MRKHLYPQKLLLFTSAFLALLLLLPGHGSAQTTVCNFQPGAHFTLAGSPYTLTCNYTIPAGDSLVVDAGVRLVLDNSRIDVNGKLSVRGTQRDSVFIVCNAYLSSIHFTGTGTGSMSYMSLRNLDTTIGGGSSLTLDDGLATRMIPTVSNCRFTSFASARTIDINLGLSATTNVINSVAQRILVQGSRGQSGRLRYCGPQAVYTFPYVLPNIILNPTDSLVVDAGVHIDLNANSMQVNGLLRMRGTTQDSIVITSNSSPASFRFFGNGTGSFANVSFRYGTSLSLEGAGTPLVHDCYFQGNGFYVSISATSPLRLTNLKFAGFQQALEVPYGNVVITNSRFGGLNPKYGINAYNNSSVSAVNCNFGHPSGPYNLSRNPTGLGCQITNNVCLTTGAAPVAGFDFAIDGNNVAFVNTSVGTSSYTWNFGNGSTSTLANPLKTLPVGNYNVCLTASVASSLGCTAPIVCKTVSIKGLASITTDHGGNTGAVSVVVRGGGFLPHMQLFLRRAGQANIVGDTVVTRNIGELTTSFNLSGKALGQWDVVIVYPNGTSAVLPNGFTIEAGTDPKLWVNLTGPSILRIGFRQVYTLAYGNNGNTDAILVPLIIEGLPKGTVIELLDSTFQVNRVPGRNHSTVYPYDSLKCTILDSVSNTVFRILFIKRIAASSTSTLNLVFRLPNNNALLHTTPDISAEIYEPTLSSVDGLHRGESINDVAECMGAVVGAAVDFLSIISPLGAAKDCGIGVTKIGLSLFKHYVSQTDRTPLDQGAFAWDGMSTAISCIQVVVPQLRIAKALAKEGGLLHDIVGVHQQAGNAASSIGQAGVSCGNAYRKAYESKIHPFTGNATDPNAKYGPGGSSTHHYINKDAPLAYSVSFENAATSNLNAQTVRVVDTLSTQAFDLASFAFTSVTIGTSTYALPAPAKSFVHDFDFVRLYGVKARVVGTFDAATGIVRWTFFSIDPATNQVTTNALAGFLPPDVVSPQGQGYVSFLVQANAARQTGDVIRNRASIVFDENPVIRTNIWQNVFDLVPPISHVTAVVPTTDGKLQVSWTGTDVGSGIQTYDLMYTENGGEPLKWLANTSATSTLFTGNAGAQYCFYSVARDSANNVEAKPVVPGICQKMPGTAPDALTVYPNPTPGVFNLQTNALQAGPTTLVVSDIIGQQVYRQDIVLTIGIRNTQVDISTLKPGLYLVRMNINGKMQMKKLMKI